MRWALGPSKAWSPSSHRSYDHGQMPCVESANVARPRFPSSHAAGHSAPPWLGPGMRIFISSTPPVKQNLFQLMTIADV